MYSTHRPASGTPPSSSDGATSVHPAQQPTRRRPLVGLLKLVAILFGVAMGVAAFRLPVFAVTEVDVVGLHHLSEAAILSRVSVQGQNLLALPVEDLTATLTQHPWVRDVEVQRRLMGRVTLFVTEREPAVIWEVGKQQFLIDRDGTVLETAKGDSPLPLIRDLDGAAPHPGDKLNADAVTLALTLTDILPKEIGQQAKFFEYLSYGGLVVQTDKGKRARFGDSSDVQWKLAVWKGLLQEGETAKLKVGHVDLRFGDRPFFRP